MVQFTADAYLKDNKKKLPRFVGVEHPSEMSHRKERGSKGEVHNKKYCIMLKVLHILQCSLTENRHWQKID